MSNPTAPAIEPTVEGNAAGPIGRTPPRRRNAPPIGHAGVPPRPRPLLAANEDGPPWAALVDAARTGSEDAWERLYVLAYPKLHAYARRRLPSAEHADDAVAEAMARAVGCIDTWAGEGGGFLAWLYGILRHVVVDAQRAAFRERPGRHADLPSGAQEPPDTAEPGDRLLQQDEAARLRAAFERLAPDEQEILELRVVAGLAAEEVAGLLGRRPGAVRMAQSRALAHLRRLLGADFAVDAAHRQVGAGAGTPSSATFG